MSTDPGPYSIGSDVWPGLAKMAEECGELVQVIGKIMGLGGAENYTHWDGNDVRERLEEEVADVWAAMSFLIKHNPIRPDVIGPRMRKKLETFEGWHEGQSKTPESAAT